jgi:glycosyltransferase involved in cell wall biosynthesis
MPEVSVLIPVFNGADRVARALDSIREQTYRDFEVVVLDDGSTDETAEVVARYPEARLLRQENQGIGAARQRLTEAAGGNWVAFCDHDDVWRPGKLARQMAAVGASTVLVHSHYVVRLADGGEVVRAWTPPADATALDHLLPDNRVHTSSVLFRRETMLAAGGFPVDSSRAEDYAAWFRLASRGSFRLVPEVLAVKYARRNSASAATLAWYAAEREVLARDLLARLDLDFAAVDRARYRQLARRKIAVIASLEAELLDREGHRKEARERHLQAVRGHPRSPGAWLRFGRHLLGR